LALADRCWTQSLSNTRDRTVRATLRVFLGNAPTSIEVDIMRRILKSYSQSVDIELELTSAALPKTAGRLPIGRGGDLPGHGVALHLDGYDPHKRPICSSLAQVHAAARLRSCRVTGRT